MSTIRGLAHPTLQTPQTGPDATWQVPRVGLALALLAVLGFGLALIGQAAPTTGISPAPRMCTWPSGRKCSPKSSGCSMRPDQNRRSPGKRASAATDSIVPTFA